VPPDSAGPDGASREFLMEQLASSSRVSITDTVEAPGGGAGPDAAPLTDVTCQIELAVYNPGFWNNNPTTLHNNNCYNYASNRKTNTFAQPGRGSGHMYTALTCAAVTQAALSDGLHKRYNCFPVSEKPRYLV